MYNLLVGSGSGSRSSAGGALSLVVLDIMKLNILFSELLQIERS